jgi:hypothetical protein
LAADVVLSERRLRSLEVCCVSHISSRREVGRVSCGRCAKKAPAKKKAATKKKK